ncbi:hypothetical protein MHTCC0001_06520 [Flavobacteriaceae bacterium MHTCC 0001]
MKKIIFFTLLMLTGELMFSQTVILNYDGVNPASGSQNYGGVIGMSVANPDVVAPNTTANVMELGCTPSTDFWGGWIQNLTGVVDIANNGNFITFLARATGRNDFEIGVRFNDAAPASGMTDTGEDPTSGRAMYTGNGDWQLIEAEVSYEATDFDGTGKAWERGEKEQSYAIMTYLPNVEDSDTTYTVWIDEVTQNSASLSTESFNTKELSVYPNPASLVVNIKGQIDDDFAYIYNVTGGLVSTKNITGKFNSVDVSALASGIYFLKLDSGSIYKFVKK